MNAKIVKILIGLLFLTAAFILPFFLLRFFFAAASFMLFMTVVFLNLFPKSIEIKRNEHLIFTPRFKPVYIELTIKNRSPFLFSSLQIEDAVENLYMPVPPVFLETLKPFEEKNLRYVVEGNQRGIYSISRTTVSGHSPFFFDKWERIFNFDSKIVVYPALPKVHLGSKFGQAGGCQKSRSRINEDTSRFMSIRPYITGDDPRRINWKATAKQGKIMTTEYEATFYNKAFIILNLSADDYGTKYVYDSTEKAIEITAGLIQDCAQNGQKFGFYTNGSVPAGPEEIPVYFPLGEGLEQTAGILKTLALVNKNTKAEPVLSLLEKAREEVKSNGILYLISPSLKKGEITQLPVMAGKFNRIEFLEIIHYETKKEQIISMIKNNIAVYPVRIKEKEFIYET